MQPSISVTLSPGKATTSAPPAASENTKSNKQSCVTSPSSSTNVPAPAGITAPENEKPRTVQPPACTTKPADAASPPAAPVAHPS